MDKKRPIIIHSKYAKKMFFCSDQHFGFPNEIQSKVRELIFIDFLDSIKNRTQVVFLLGDLFDFWHEYKHVIPKGYIRLLGKLAELSDLGIQFYFFTGNHDLWINDYFEKELGFIVLRERTEFIIDNKLFLIGHGDGLGPSDFCYKRIKKIFNHPLSQFFFRWFHPDLGIPLGKYFSIKNKYISKNKKCKNEENDRLIQYVKFKLKKKNYDYFIFGHQHLPVKISILESIYFNLGDWIRYFTYLEYCNQKLKLKKWKIVNIT